VELSCWNRAAGACSWAIIFM